MGDGTITLSHCRELRELEIPLADPGAEVVKLLSSITSTDIRKVTFVHVPSFRRPPGWPNLDDPLCQLVGRPGCKHRVEVCFRFLDAGAMEVDGRTGEPRVVKSLTRFKEGGQLRVVWMDPNGGECVVYPREGAK